MCLGLQSGLTEDGTYIWVYPCTAEEPAQKWAYDAEGRIRNKKDPTKCITSSANIGGGVGAIKRIDVNGAFGAVGMYDGCGVVSRRFDPNAVVVMEVTGG
eukprot:scaffold85933_cov36-Cyclotella_meneghiniana.AAC.1